MMDPTAPFIPAMVPPTQTASVGGDGLLVTSAVPTTSFTVQSSPIQLTGMAAATDDQSTSFENDTHGPISSKLIAITCGIVACLLMALLCIVNLSRLLRAMQNFRQKSLRKEYPDWTKQLHDSLAYSVCSADSGFITRQSIETQSIQGYTITRHTPSLTPRHRSPASGMTHGEETLSGTMTIINCYSTTSVHYPTFHRPFPSPPIPMSHPFPTHMQDAFYNPPVPMSPVPISTPVPPSPKLASQAPPNDIVACEIELPLHRRKSIASRHSRRSAEMARSSFPAKDQPHHLGVHEVAPIRHVDTRDLAIGHVPVDLKGDIYSGKVNWSDEASSISPPVKVDSDDEDSFLESNRDDEGSQSDSTQEQYEDQTNEERLHHSPHPLNRNRMERLIGVTSKSAPVTLASMV